MKIKLLENQYIDTVLYEAGDLFPCNGDDDDIRCQEARMNALVAHGKAEFVNEDGSVIAPAKEAENSEPEPEPEADRPADAAADGETTH